MVLVKDADPDEHLTPTVPLAPSAWPMWEGRLFFSTDDGTHGRELWTLYGTEAGTLLVEDINLTGDGYPSGPTDVGKGDVLHCRRRYLWSGAVDLRRN